MWYKTSNNHKVYAYRASWTRGSKHQPTDAIKIRDVESALAAIHICAGFAVRKTLAARQKTLLSHCVRLHYGKRSAASPVRTCHGWENKQFLLAVQYVGSLC